MTGPDYEPVLHEGLMATVRYRPRGGLLLQVHQVREDVAERRLLVILERFGWLDSRLDPYSFAGYSTGAQLISFGYMPHRAEQMFTADPHQPTVFGWRMVTPEHPDPAPLVGRAAPAAWPLPADHDYVWRLPVYRQTDGAFADWQCWCEGAQAHRAMCDRCPPERQEAVYGYAVGPRDAPDPR